MGLTWDIAPLLRAWRRTHGKRAAAARMIIDRSMAIYLTHNSAAVLLH